MKKTKSNKAWFLVLPVFILVAFSAIVPLMTVVNYSIQDIFGATRYFVGVEWYREILNDSRLQDSLVRQFVFSGSVLLIEVPLGIAVALMMPKAGKWSVVTLLVLALPLLVPLNVVGTIWQIFGRADIGLFGWGLNALGMDYNYAANPMDAWFTVLLMDVWHWTSLIALLCYSGLRAIPDAYYQAASIDRASNWAVFRYIQLPKLKSVLLIGILLRFMDSFMIYTEPFVLTGGGPGNSTTFLSQALTKMAVGQFDIGPAGAFSIIYFLIILLVSWLFYTAMTHGDSK
ncbi:carbohydrate ABC transporter membrane protein 1, CUT1 family [Psychromonas ingrahamii 37]|uniref:Carbohydrate ABC transporter membrane protein 1, CUT1 family n=1 Tax=Psychromonas ingrahamii (strain DSM 17664 / CCUG 51855 / 37) TaxID=357804 RepID=A1SZE5_PSYIN|nr:sugar ABC transporter permease [Psychromonas ingrahamii]ABM04860.1 carbohydrate ABC transporter membrane protein 1, CUT1 family [Psychromonas ingrahamii 37]